MIRENAKLPPEKAASLLTLAAYLPFLILRIMIAGGGEPGRLSLIGSVFSNRAKLPSFLPSMTGTGYDGQFFLRLALNPFNLAKSAYGITFDTPFRPQRIGYPFFAWLASFGDAHLVPYALIAVNLVAVCTIAWSAARLARGSGHPILAGFAAATFFGYAMSTGRDLSEPTAAALALIAMNLFEARKYFFAGLVFAAAALTLETELIVPIAIGVAWLYQQAKQTGTPILRRLDSRAYSWLLPGVATILWQLTLTHVEHTFPGASDLAGNLGVPVLTLFVGTVTHLHQLSLTNLIWFGQFAVFAVMVVLAFSSLRSLSVPLYLKIAFVLMLLLAISTSGEVWNHSSYFRAFDLLWLTALLTWIRSKPNRPALAAVGPIAWIVSAIPLIVFL